MYRVASYARHPDLSSQLRYIILLADEKDNCLALVSSCRKAKRGRRIVQRSALMDFTDAFDIAFYFNFDNERVAGFKILPQMYTNSLSLFDTMTKTTVPSKKSLMVDLACVKNGYNTDEFKNIFFVRSEYSRADDSAKHKRVFIVNDKKTSRNKHRLGQRILRKKFSGTVEKKLKWEFQ